MDAYTTNVLIWWMFLASSMKSRHPLRAGFLEEFGDLQEHEIREHWECVQTGCKEACWASKHWKKNIHLAQLCEKTFFQHLVIAGNYYKIRPDEDDGWGTIAPLCREYSSSRSCPKTKALAAIPEGTTVGPVYIIEILDGYGIDVAIQSISNPDNTSYVVITREAERFVNEIHSWSQTRTQVQKWSARRPPRIRKKWSLWRKKSNQQLQGNLGVSEHEGNSCGPSQPHSKEGFPIHKKNHSHDWEEMERSSCLLTRWRTFGGVSFQDCHNNASSFSTKRNDKLMVQDIGIQLIQYWWERLHMKEHMISAINIVYAWFMRAAQRKGSNIAQIKMGIYVTSELFSDTLVVFQ